MFDFVGRGVGGAIGKDAGGGGGRKVVQGMGREGN